MTDDHRPFKWHGYTFEYEVEREHPHSGSIMPAGWFCRLGQERIAWASHPTRSSAKFALMVKLRWLVSDHTKQAERLKVLADRMAAELEKVQ